MANWKHKLPVKDIWDWAETVDKEAHATELGEKVAKRIESMAWAKRYPDLDELCEQFRGVTNIEELDAVLATFYDWADEGHRCWVETF